MFEPCPIYMFELCMCLNNGSVFELCHIYGHICVIYAHIRIYGPICCYSYKCCCQYVKGTRQLMVCIFNWCRWRVEAMTTK